MKRFARFVHQPVRPLGPGGKLITGCAAHRKLARDIAAEGTVLLKNDGILPFAAGTKLCPFGNGFSQFLFGGGGSGWVECDKQISFSQGLRQQAAQGTLEVFLPLLDYYDAIFLGETHDISHNWGDHPEEDTLAIIPDDRLYTQAKAFGGTALFCISRFSSESNIWDRSGQEGDYLLTQQEQQLFDRLCADFGKIVVVLNVCGPVALGQFKENSKVAAILYPMFSGGDAGTVLCDLLTGVRYPSGHLQDTLAEKIEDYPSTSHFSQYTNRVDYEEDIFVGYRYFETMAKEKVVYPYGFGLSYTDFAVTCEKAELDDMTVRLAVRVKNTGSRPGKEVVQAYLQAPQGKLGKAAKILTAFRKTKELQPGEDTAFELHFNLREFGSFDDIGKVRASAFVLEQGAYTVALGTNVREAAPVLDFTLTEDIICRQCHSYMAPIALAKRLTADGSYEALPAPQPHRQPAPVYKVKAKPEQCSLADALAAGKTDEMLANMTDNQLGALLYGHPMMNPSNTCGIGAPLDSRYSANAFPLVPTADGPAGFRAMAGSGVSSTFFPCANVLAQTWEPKFAEKMGKAGALEVKENNAGIWLAPALNIHRNPMCGRNFEYYSEDPLISGVFAAAFVKGVQSQNIAATIKHFCCNNKETNRRNSDSRVSQRALREIYLRGFEIAVKQGKPWAVMTSYNLVNSQRSSSNWDAIQGILKGEWKYRGLVMTDWSTYSTLDEEIRAGGHVKMPESITDSKALYDFDQAIAQGKLTRENLLHAAKAVVELLAHLE